MSDNVMDVTVQRDDLVRELAVAEQAASRKPTIPVLSNALITAMAGRLVLAATDLEVWLVTNCPCETTVAGSATVSAQKLHEMARSLPSGTAIRLVSDGSKGGVRLDGGGFTARLQALPVSDFPLRPEMPTEWHELPRTVLRDMIVRTRYAVKEDQKYFMNGTMLRVAADKMVMVATDGHRMAIVTATRTGTEVKDAILPKRTLEALVPTLDSDGEVAQYAATDNHLFFQVGERQLVSRVVDGKFPAWERILPKGHDTPVTVARESLLGALRRTAMVSDREAMAVELSVTKAGHLCLKSSSVAVGDADEAVAVTYTGDDMLLKANVNYVIDFVGVAGTENVTMEMVDANRPLVLREQAESFECVGIVMPMRI